MFLLMFFILELFIFRNHKLYDEPFILSLLKETRSVRLNP
jgi:hypothetical protein